MDQFQIIDANRLILVTNGNIICINRVYVQEF
jgi:hypothetical protein